MGGGEGPGRSPLWAQILAPLSPAELPCRAEVTEQRGTAPSQAGGSPAPPRLLGYSPPPSVQGTEQEAVV